MECRSSVLTWQECISALPDNKFFDVVRLYLGEVKTPYNKQRLIEQLAGFLRNEENLSNMMLFLDETDIKFLTAIHFIPNATQNILLDFFSSEFEYGDIYGEISNLISRLLIFIEKDKYSDKEYLRINPLIWDSLQPRLSISNILSSPSVMAYSMEDNFTISPDLLVSLICFIKNFGCSCKSDGTIKKNDEKRLVQIFHSHPSCMEIIQLLINGFLNLNLITEGEKSFLVDDQRFNLFANLKEVEQYGLLCAASCSRFSRDGLRKEAQLLLDCISSIPKTGYTKSTLKKLAFLVESYNDGGASINVKSRFSKMLDAARYDASKLTADAENAGKIIESLLDSAIMLGLLQKLGRTENNEDLFIPGLPFQREDVSEHFTDANLPKLLNIDSTYTVTIMPGLSLKRLLPLSDFLSIKTSGVVTEFEITRTASSIAFDKGWLPSAIFEELEKYTYYPLPQNLKMTISDWYNSYSSAMLYKGYVLKVAENNISFTENNPNINKYIKEKLAEGVYLLNIPITADISSFINESGLEFMGKIKCSGNQSERIGFPALRRGKSLSLFNNSAANTNEATNKDTDESSIKTINISEAAAVLSALKNAVADLELSKNQKETLINKINQRLILNQKQLEIASIRTEILEAEGMDYAGKVHLFEAAIKEEDFIEITMPQYNNTAEYFKIVGKPLGLSKQYADTIARVEVFPNHEIENFVVSRITHLRRLRY
ncbi:MAG: helicase-associated domain-containing protein [Treponema sp.]|nr:helicase-associated domain-containing protein [Treponema sp.]